MHNPSERRKTRGVHRDLHQLIARLKDRGVHNPLVERLRTHLSTEERHDHLVHEIHAEIAQALGRAEAKVVAALLEVAAADADIDNADDDAQRSQALHVRETWRRAALQARQDYKIHREAVGLRRNAHLDALYPVPPPRD